MEGKIKRDTVAQEIVSTLERLACMAEKTANVAAEQLHPICSDDTPDFENACGEPSMRVYPPLFKDMRGQMQVIENALHRIDEVLGRCEV